MVAQSQARPERRGHCPKVRAAIVHNRVSTWKAQDALGQRNTRVSKTPVQGCGYAAWVRDLWAARALRTARRARWLVLPATRDWATAVRVTQRVYPHTARWMLSCSAAEGGHGRWVRYGGGNYYAGYERTDAVGGPMQYRWSTFKGHYRHALVSLRSRGFVVHLPPPGDVRAWLSMSAQALAAGWARWSGNDARHWTASWGNGC